MDWSPVARDIAVLCLKGGGLHSRRVEHIFRSVKVPVQRPVHVGNTRQEPTSHSFVPSISVCKESIIEWLGETGIGSDSPPGY